MGVGWMSDRFGRLPTVTVTYLLSIVGTTSLLLVAIWPNLVLVYGFVLFFGSMQGASCTVQRRPASMAETSDELARNPLTKHYHGGAIGSIFGMLSIAMGLGQAIGSFASGLLQDWTGAYFASFSLGIFGSSMGLLMFWLVRSLRREELAQPAELQPRMGGPAAGK